MITRRLPLLVAAAALVSTGCTGKDVEGNVPAAATAAQATPNVVTFTARDYAFEGPTEIPAGMTTLRLLNKGPELHHASLVKLDEGKTAQDVLVAIKAGGPPPRWAIPLGGPNAPVPGEEADATSQLEPGNYALLCFVESPDHVPHMAKGMVHNFRVVPAKTASAAEPKADIVMRLDDYKFELSKPLTPGKHVIRVENAGPQPHEVQLVQLAPGKTMHDVIAWIMKPQGPPPGKPIGGIAGTAPGTHASFTANLTSGEYALICFIPDAKDGKPHLQHGMMQQIKI